MSKDKFPSNAGKDISRAKAQEECRAYQAKYPNSPESHNMGLSDLLEEAQKAKDMGATAFAFLNGLRGDEPTFNLAFLDASGAYVIPPSEAALEEQKAFVTKYPDRTRLYAWGVDYLSKYLTQLKKSGSQLVIFSNALNDNGEDTLCVDGDVPLESDYFSKDANDGGSLANEPILCPPICP